MSAATMPARPLAGRCIVVTRPRAQAPALADRLAAAGASVLTVPTIAIEAPESWDPLDRALDRVADYRWLVFTSANGVAMVRQRWPAAAWQAPGRPASAWRPSDRPPPRRSGNWGAIPTWCQRVRGGRVAPDCGS